MRHIAIAIVLFASGIDKYKCTMHVSSYHSNSNVYKMSNRLIKLSYNFFWILSSNHYTLFSV